jgi:hypothetical protein
VRIEHQRLLARPQRRLVIVRRKRVAGGSHLRGDFARPPLLQILKLRTLSRRFGRFHGSRRGRALYRLNQPANVGFPPNVAQLDRVAMRERGQIGRQILCSGHRAPLDEHGNHANLFVLERGCDFNAQEVFRIVEAAPLEPGILNGQPVSTDDGEQHGAGFELVLDELDEVHAGRNVVGVLEDAVRAELRAQGGQQREHMPRAVLAAIADEDARFGLRIRCGHLSPGSPRLSHSAQLPAFP